MQLVNTDRDTILRPLQIVSGIVERRHTMPILANILIRRENEVISFLSTDAEIQITTSMVAPGEPISLATTVAARKLLDILRALPDAGAVNISLVDKRMTVQSGKSHFALQTLAAEDFPVLSEAPEYSASLTIAQKTLKQLFAMLHYAMAQQDIRYYLNGLLLVLEGNSIKAVATDSHRLAFCEAATEQNFERQEVIIPRKTIVELQRLLEDSDAPIQIDMAMSQIRFCFNGIVLVSKLVEGKFPDYKRVLPKGYTLGFEISRELFLQALQRAAIMTSDKFRGIRVVVAPGMLQIISTNAEQEEATEELEIAYDGPAIDMGFNIGYLQDVLSNHKCDTMHMAFADSSSSALFSIPENAHFKYVVMPMRI